MSTRPVANANHPFIGAVNEKALAERRRVARELWLDRQRMRLLAEVEAERDPAIFPRDAKYQQGSWWWRSTK